MSGSQETQSFARDRLNELLRRLEALAAGETDTALALSPMHDELDAIAFGINVLADELRWAHLRVIESERTRGEQLREQAQRLSSANFATAFHANPCAMTIMRLSDGTISDVNGSFEQQSGYARTEVLGRTLEQVGLWVQPDDAAAVIHAIGATGSLRSCEVRYRNKEGAPRTAVYSAEIIVFSGEHCVLGVGLDVTDRKHAEIQASALRNELAHRARVSMAEVLTGSIAHEINQPLTAVMANAQAALHLLDRHPRSSPELREVLLEILDDNTRASEVLLRLRTLLSKGPTEQEPVNVNALVSEIVKLIQGSALGRQIAVAVDLAPFVEPVMGDRIQLQQVVLNLLMNALDAVEGCAPAERHVRLRTSTGDSCAVIEVSDRGSGLSDEALRMIFEPFYTTKPTGMGLGLPLSLTIVNAHGGTLAAVRNVGGGMTFSARFPTSSLSADSS